VVSAPDSPTAAALRDVARSLVRRPRGLEGMKLPLSVSRH
jgi:ATP-binding protein involved in chromosome partitioning